MIEYFDLVKGSGGAKSINQHDGFGDLLSECRVSAKEEVNEQEVDEAGIERVSKEAIAKELYDKSFAELADEEKERVNQKWKDKLMGRESKVNEWIEDKQMDVLLSWVVVDSDEELRQKLQKDYQEAKEEAGVDFDQYFDQWYEDYKQTLGDTGEIEYLIAKDDLESYLRSFISESRVNELDEPDLERPEKARKLKPKRKKLLRPKPDVDEIPKEEPEPDEVPKEEPSKEPEVPEIGEPDPDEVPPPPEEIKEPEQPIEMRKEYVGRSEETHYYLITTEGEGGVIDDLVIADQEGTKIYSAKDNSIEVSEEGIADFIIQAYRDVDIAQIERSIYMKYVYPELAKGAPEEEMVEEPEEEPKEEKDKGPLGPEEEEELPRESKKITDNIDKENDFKNLIEMKVTDGIGNEFDVLLVDDDGENATITINGIQYFRDSSIVRLWRDDDGSISEEGLERLAEDALAMMEEDEYQELVTNGREGPEEEIGDVEKPVPDEVDEPIKDRPEPEKDDLLAPGIEDTTGDVDVSKGDIHQKPKFRPKKKEAPGEEFPEEGFDEPLEGKNQPGVRTGTGPAKGSYQRKIKGDVGKRKQAGEKCPKENKDNENIEGDNNMLKEGKVDTEYMMGQLFHLVNKADDDDILLRKMYRALGVSFLDPEGKKVDSEYMWDALSNYVNDIDGDDVRIRKFWRKLGYSDEWEDLGLVDPTEVEENIKGDNEMIDEKTVLGLLASAKKLEVRAKEIRKEAEELEKKDKEAKAKKEGIDPKKEDSEEKKIKKLAEEEELTETDVAKGAKALVQLLKDAVKAGDYAKAAEYATKAAEIEAMVPAEAEAEVKKDDKAEPGKKDDKEDKKPEKKEGPEKEEKPEEEEPADDNDNADEKKKPPVCKKCGKRHWPFEKCSESEEVDEAKDKDKEAKAKKDKKEKEAKAKKDKKEKEDKEKKAKKDKEAKAKKVKKESKIPVEDTEDISERKGLNLLNELLRI